MEGDVSVLLKLLLELGGFGALVAVLVNIGKTVGLVPDGSAPVVATGLNLAGLVGLYVLGIVQPGLNIGALDGTAGTIAQILSLTFGLAWQMFSSRITHEKALKGTPLIGKSYSGAEIKAFLAGTGLK